MGNGEHKIGTEAIIEKLEKKQVVKRDEIVRLLSLTDPEEAALLFAAAQEARDLHFGNKIFLYGFVYFSTYCRNDCTFCFYRRSNKTPARYRKEPAEVLEAAQKLADSGVHLIDLTMGEDPYYFAQHQFEELLEVTSLVKENTGLPVMISPGLVPQAVIKEFKEAGADWYACYQETHNRELFAKMRLDQDYDERLNVKRHAHRLGLLAEEGLLVGIGETHEDLAVSMEVMRELLADQVRVMSFVPQKGTPLEKTRTGSRLRELLVIAVMRLLFPDRLIPGSLDVDGIKGLEDRLKAGANVVTSIIPPQEGLMGVSQSTLDIDEGGRTVAETIPIIENLGLKAATAASYQAWVEDRKKMHQGRAGQKVQES